MEISIIGLKTAYDKRHIAGVILEGNQMLETDMASMMAQYLNKLPEHGRLVEIGTGYGESAFFFAKTKPNWSIITIDGFGMFGDGRIWPELHADNIWKAYNTYKECKNIIQILGNSQEIKWELPVDAIYLDGDHRYEGVKKDFEIYVPWLKVGGYVFLDDYIQPNNPTNGVKKLVDEVLDKCSDYWELLFEGITAVLKRKQ